MYTMNQITIIGFAGSDAEAHYTQNGTLIVTLSVATKESWKDAGGSWQSRTDWHRIVSFGKQAEFTRTLTKGSYVMVQGAVRTREYERGWRETPRCRSARRHHRQARSRGASRRSRRRV
jgi:single-strand DNA-binding protein